MYSRDDIIVGGIAILIIISRDMLAERGSERRCGTRDIAERNQINTSSKLWPLKQSRIFSSISRQYHIISLVCSSSLAAVIVSEPM